MYARFESEDVPQMTADLKIRINIRTLADKYITPVSRLSGWKEASNENMR